ncbi:endolytic transglycosylase MltG [Altererythrobacter sp. MF3-039]|uniref:endolytic transglycosylase MltG n=1 Tax=Altererythrobacter sp. MF3-039 TaxID=3252901 RepID=UPI00390C83CB
MRRFLLAVVSAAILGAIIFLPSRLGFATIEEDTAFIVPSGSSLTAVAQKLETEGLISSADGFLLRARLLGPGDPIQAGEFQLTSDMDQGDILRSFQSGDVIRRFVTIPEGMPSIMVHERLMAEELLTGDVSVPPEGTILPQTYDFERGEERAALVARMQKSMGETLEELWGKRSETTAVKTPREAIILASIVEKETSKPEELRMVAGVLSNRLRIGMQLGADATTIYPITKGKPLGRRIRVSELRDPNPYNTRAISGLPVGPITNPGRQSIEAVLDPAETDAFFYVADGTGGHVFAKTLDEHNANVAKWRQIRRDRGEIE